MFRRSFAEVANCLTPHFTYRSTHCLLKGDVPRIWYGFGFDICTQILLVQQCDMNNLVNLKELRLKPSNGEWRECGM